MLAFSPEMPFESRTVENRNPEHRCLRTTNNQLPLIRVQEHYDKDRDIKHALLQKNILQVSNSPFEVVDLLVDGLTAIVGIVYT